ncbi:MAG: glycosyltransferase [Gammaproteobacteria bacterium]|nr:glycosyltransferase [Gammaproteobacteria bacterium]
MNKKPFFSVVIPTYNRADTIQLTLDACWQQSDKDFEVVLVDDGSQDNTEEVASRIEDERLRYIRQDNAGPAAARNHGMREARGDYIAFLDSDDVWYAGHLASVRDAIAAGHDFIYSQIIVDRGVDRYWLKPDRAMTVDESIFDYLYKAGGFIQTSTMVVSRELAERVEWDENVTYGDNDQFAIDLCHAGAVPYMLPRSHTLYCDVMNPAALSKLPMLGGGNTKYTNFFDWMATQQPHMSADTWLAFRAHHESPALARTAPRESAGLIWQAYRQGVLSSKGMLRQFIQTFAPRLYRRLVDTYVRFRGAPLESVQP